MTVGSPPSRTVTTEFVVPRSIPTARAMLVAPSAPPGLDDTAVDESAALKFARPGPDLQIEGQELESMWLNYGVGDRKSTRLNSSHVAISYAVFCLKKKNKGRDSTS